MQGRERQHLGDFDRVLYDGLRALAQSKGPCPSVEQLSQRRPARPDAEQSEALDRHVAACGICQALLARMDEFDRAADSARPRRAVVEFLLRPTLAYGVAFALLATISVLVLRARHNVTIPELRPAVESIHRFELPQTRLAANAVIRPGIESHFVLTFFVPVQAGRRYFVEIRDGAGRETVPRIEIANPDPQGNVALTCRRDAFPPGDYILTVTEVQSDREFRYAFRIE